MMSRPSSRSCSRRPASSPASSRGTTRCCCSRKLAPVLAAGNCAMQAVRARRCPPSLSRRASTTCPAASSLLAGGGNVGERLIDDERVDGIAFTGSVATGTRIAERAARRIARVNLELGGKDPFIVCADVAGEIEIAARGGAWAAFLNAGQVCASAERFYVERTVYDDFLSAFVDHAHAHGRRSDGPGHRHRPDGERHAQREKVVRQVESAVAAGAQVVAAAATAPTTSAATTPTVVTGAPAETDLLREETFGPVAPIVPVADLDQAIKLANASPYGLGANVYARPRDRDPVRPRAARRHRLDQRPADRQRRRAVRRDEALRERTRARPGGARRLPGDQARPHRDQARDQGLVVSVRIMITSGRRATL